MLSSVIRIVLSTSTATDTIEHQPPDINPIIGVDVEIPEQFHFYSRQLILLDVDTIGCSPKIRTFLLSTNVLQLPLYRAFFCTLIGLNY